LSRRVLVAALALLACSVSVGTALFVRTPVTHTIVIEGMQFTPTRLTIRPGDSVTWVNKDIVAHTATTAASATQSFDSGMLAVEQSWTRSFTAAGSYDYICTYHPTMTGVIEVVAPASAGRRPRR
jgi:plastocyanin